MSRVRVLWEMEAWGESWQKGREGRPSFWSKYIFTSEAEAQRERARLEKKWKNEECQNTFDLYRVTNELVPRRRRKP